MKENEAELRREACARLLMLVVSDAISKNAVLFEGFSTNQLALAFDAFGAVSAAKVIYEASYASGENPESMIEKYLNDHGKRMREIVGDMLAMRKKENA